MTTTAAGTGSALDTALAYHEAWTSHDLDTAMAYVGQDITCVSPGGTIRGVDAYRQFLGGFMAKLTGVETTAAFGDETTAVLFYYPQTAATTEAATAEQFTVEDGKITSNALVFDRLSFAPKPD